ncbi:MAG: hypothetical protein J7500_14385 [Sphingomonas sp.]|uniref:DUF5818 domain-containing protein n=1 Tax=Sphingomonas sp. TaxID=28214 RepID=UPI001B0A1014|nr:DUF5818 domain-containing protein [Sphingomonas sp.]MBO9623893.1 hypothetical protein [Sphingomonas sp.]
MDKGHAAAIGERIRVTGELACLARGPVIVDSAGVPVWFLRVPSDCALPSGGRIVVEGVRSGLDRIDVEWAGGAA